MQIRPAKTEDLSGVQEIDGTIVSVKYLHVERGAGDEGGGAGQRFSASWRLEERRHREKLIESNRLGDDAYFTLKQIVSGNEEGIAWLVEHEDQPVASVVARPEPATGTLQIVDLRVDFDFRRQGMGTALAYQVIQSARESEMRAVAAQTLTNNLPAAALLAKCGFELSGVDTRRHSNHDLVKEAVTLFWYVPLD